MKILSILHRYLILVMYLIGSALGALVYGAKRFNHSVSNHSSTSNRSSTSIESYPSAPPTAYHPTEESEPIRHIIEEHHIVYQRQQTLPPDYDYDKPFKNTLKSYEDDGRFNMRWL